MWVDNLQKVLSMPPLSVNPTSLLMPIGETRLLTVQSLLAGQIQADVSAPSVISVDAQSRPGNLIIKGENVGDVTITVRCEDQALPVQIMVRKYAAGILPGTPIAGVTGKRTPGALVSRAAEPDFLPK
jgi:hypothetical protein